ncbi:ATPase [Nesterenkonia xinjiangensis]
MVEGDALDLAHPAPWHSGIAFRNLSAIWANYRAFGYNRLVFTNTVSVLEGAAIADAMGDQPRMTAVLLQATTRTIHDRLGRRERGESLDAHAERSRVAALRLDTEAGPAVHRINTESRSPHEVALQMNSLLGWVG